MNDYIKLVFENFNLLQVINPNDKECLKLYGQFLIYILNERTNGEHYIIKSKETINNFNNVKFFNKSDIFSLSSDGTPCILSNPIEVKNN